MPEILSHAVPLLLAPVDRPARSGKTIWAKHVVEMRGIGTCRKLLPSKKNTVRQVLRDTG